MNDDDYKFSRIRISEENARAVKLENTIDVLKADAQIACFVEQGMNDKQTLARISMDSRARASLTMREYSDTAAADFPSLVNELRHQCENFNAESTLIAQAVTLDAIFNSLATQAACVGFNTNTDKAEQLLRMALRAQNQAGKTMQVILQNQQNKQLTEYRNGTNLDGTAKIKTVGSNKTVATLFKINGRKDD